MTYIVLLFGVAWGVHLGACYALERAKPTLHEEHQRIDRQHEYWNCLDEMWTETVAWVQQRDPADWWKRGDSAPSFW